MKNLVHKLNIIYILLTLVFFPSCSKNDLSIKKNIQSEKIYTQEEYMTKFKNEILNHDEVFYVGLELDNLMLLDKPFKSATLEEINNDVAYNRNSIRLEHEYAKTIDFLKKDKNLNKLSKHLNYNTTEIKVIVFKGNNVIVSYLGMKRASYESYLVSIKQYNLKIKLISYLYGH